MLEVWPDNERALALFRQIGTRWVSAPMGGGPLGLRWEAIYPLMDRMALDSQEWDVLHSDLMVLENAAINTMQEFATMNKKTG